jgi:hypothetical protein
LSTVNDFSFRHKVITTLDLFGIELKTLDPTFKGVIFDYLSIALYNNFLNRKNFTFKICKEPLLTNHIVFYFTQNFYLVDEINELIGRMKNAGLDNHVISKYVDMQLMSLQDVQKDPTALTMKNLSGVFQLLIYGQLLALVSFIVEVCYVKMQKRMRMRRYMC